MPKRIGGHAALDLCNTWAGWGEPWNPRREWIPDYQSFVVWSLYADLIDRSGSARVLRESRRHPEEARAVVRNAHKLRRAVYRSALDPSDLRSFGVVATFARRAAAESDFVAGPDGIARWVVRPASGLKLPLLASARAAAEFLSSSDRLRVDRCPGDDCGWLFINRSGRRKWCDMTSCGNRAKVRAFHERRTRERPGRDGR